MWDEGSRGCGSRLIIDEAHPSLPFLPSLLSSSRPPLPAFLLYTLPPPSLLPSFPSSLPPYLLHVLEGLLGPGVVRHLEESFTEHVLDLREGGKERGKEGVVLKSTTLESEGCIGTATGNSFALPPSLPPSLPSSIPPSLPIPCSTAVGGDGATRREPPYTGRQRGGKERCPGWRGWGGPEGGKGGRRISGREVVGGE